MWPHKYTDVTIYFITCEWFSFRLEGKPIKPIPVAGAFDRVGVDVIKFPKSKNGKHYAVVFMDYLTKWPEVFATSDQTSPTIAKL